jgi:hypothetical protein
MAMVLLSILSGCGVVEAVGGKFHAQEVGFFFVKIARQYPGLLRTVVFDLGFSLARMTTPEEAVNLKLRLPMAFFRRLCTVLIKLSYKFLPSEKKIRKVQRQMLCHLDEASVCVEEMCLVVEQNQDKTDRVEMVPVLFCKDLESYILAVWRDLKGRYAGKTDFDNQDLVISLCLAGDKGGGFMKFHFEVKIPDLPAGSVFDVHVFAMYEASEHPDNIRKVLGRFSRAVTEMHQEDYRLDGHKVKNMLGGDYKFQDACLGTQGSSASYPSNKGYVTLSHLHRTGFF